MPIYEYQCKACNEKVEILQKIDDKPIRKCPSCGKNQLVKLISAAGFRLKGSGWYETDFKSGNKKNLHAADAGSEGASSKAGDGSKRGESAGSKGSDKSSTKESKQNKSVDSGKSA